MKTLGICASFGLHVCIINDDKVVYSYSREDELKSDNLLTVIDNGLKENKMSFADIDVIATCIGPGSFTGSRVAISLVKGLFVGQNKKLIAFNAFDCYSDGDVVLPGFGEFVYLRQNGKQSCIEIGKIENFKGVCCSDSLANFFKSKRANFDMTNIIKRKLKENEFVAIENLMPVYLRASQAEIDREKRK